VARVCPPAARTRDTRYGERACTGCSHGLLLSGDLMATADVQQPAQYWIDTGPAIGVEPVDGSAHRCAGREHTRCGWRKPAGARHAGTCPAVWLGKAVSGRSAPPRGGSDGCPELFGKVALLFRKVQLSWNGKPSKERVFPTLPKSTGRAGLLFGKGAPPSITAATGSSCKWSG
jgi:hypothetical protein